VPHFKVMTVRILTLFACSTLLWGADPQRLALALKAQADFDRLEMAASPNLREASGCVQSQAALIPVATPEELPLAHFRKGYCALMAASINNHPADFAPAAADLDKAIELWPMRASRGNSVAPPPVSAGLRVVGAIARLRAGAGESAEQRAHDELARALESRVCPASLMPPEFCENLLSVGQRWVGWLALKQGRLEEAARVFAGSRNTGWLDYVDALNSFRSRNFPAAAAAYKRAISAWETEAAQSLSAAERLSPAPDLASARTELGGAQLLAGDLAGSIATLNDAVRAAPGSPRPLYLRARAKELAGQGDAALTDYNLASRAAFANAQDLASGEAHWYRGILLYRRNDFARAEDEFSTALNSGIPSDLRQDAAAWRHLAAVAAGACVASRAPLEAALAEVSPFFPKEEARRAMSNCGSALTAAEQPK
jgi:tetratricopeptide (TPR) repeat protein